MHLKYKVIIILNIFPTKVYARDLIFPLKNCGQQPNSYSDYVINKAIRN